MASSAGARWKDGLRSAVGGRAAGSKAYEGSGLRRGAVRFMEGEGRWRGGEGAGQWRGLANPACPQRGSGQPTVTALPAAHPTGGRAPRCLLRSPPGPPPSRPPFPARPPAARRLPPTRRAVAVAVLRSLPCPARRRPHPLPAPHRLAIAAPPPSSEVDPQIRSTPPHASRRDVKRLVIQGVWSWGQQNPQLQALIQQHKLTQMQQRQHQHLLQPFPQIQQPQIGIPRQPQLRPPLTQPQRRLMQYLYHKRHRPENNPITYWRKLFEEYFVPRARERWCVSSYEKRANGSISTPQSTNSSG
ncbi:hypothetical protein U9M48_011830 [Paspalum notatum var. saurae]|uniref:Uncharacterized protein n=1 Tax=Paspalum notatum var. saurae TaxID=547442 RepID=A0AAQ3SWB7_PASNO